MQIADSLIVEGTISATSGTTGSGGTLSNTTLSGATVIGSGAVISATATIHGYPTTLVTPVQAVSAAATPFTLNVPQGAVITDTHFLTNTAFTGTTVSGEIGSASGDASFVALTSVKNGGSVVLSPAATVAAANAYLSAPASGGLVFTLAQGTPTATGSGNLLTTYVVP